MTRHGSATIDLSTEREVKIQRAFDAPMSLVFDALTKPEHVRLWFSADGVPLHVCEIDLLAGGKYHFAWHAKDVDAHSGAPSWRSSRRRESSKPGCSKGGRRPKQSRRSAFARRTLLRR